MEQVVHPAVAGRHIHRPAPDKPPLKVNVFEKMQSSNTQLLPLFPYLGPGAIVPCGAIFHGGGGGGLGSVSEANAEFGRFFHDNQADEVALAWATDARPFGAGHLRVLPNHHGVEGRVGDPASAESFAVSTITQRQTTGAEQEETVTFRCRKCHTPLAQSHYHGLPPAAAAPGEGALDAYPPLPTIVGSAAVAERYNADEQQRRCQQCGTTNPIFPLESWGWDVYARQSRIVNAARLALDEAARTRVYAEPTE
jgi:hypothetical protein